MGKISKGILGGVSGRVGTVVGSRIFGIDVLRSYQPEVRNPQTVDQTRQRNKFAILIPFLRLYIAFIRIGFSKVAAKMSPWNVAIAENLDTALEADGNNWAFHGDWLKLSKGTLSGFENLIQDDSVSGSSTVMWDDNSSNPDASADDKVYIAAFASEENKVLSVLGAVNRSAGSYTFDVSQLNHGSVLNACCFMLSADGSMVSDSQIINLDVNNV